MKIVACALMLAVLSACTVTPPRVSVKPIEITPLEVSIGGGGHGGGFCPPGQAKKGHC
ncbi:hypothetical protein EV683_106111 [Crenobacter luteus]|uniref:vir-repressed protein n=1 Tax=Crenobacter luteus TaxID=1452487 RepID=UPI001043D93C|nr:vir-repressed protein [Crenobacter luteus]TCP13676.1 hypothetical protein EV683_106111 [Crenobacter luteus]